MVAWYRLVRVARRTHAFHAVSGTKGNDARNKPTPPSMVEYCVAVLNMFRSRMSKVIHEAQFGDKMKYVGEAVPLYFGQSLHVFIVSFSSLESNVYFVALGNAEPISSQTCLLCLCNSACFLFPTLALCVHIRNSAIAESHSNTD